MPQISALAKLGPIAGWQPSATGFQAWQPNYSNYAAHSEESFSKDGQIAGLFLAYYRNQSHENKLVSSTNTLVRSNDPLWTTVDSGSRQVSFNQQDLTVRTMELRGRAAPQMVVWKWYWVDGRWTANDVVAKVYTALSQLTGHGDDSAVIILYTPLAQPGGGERVLAEFAGAAGPAIDAVLRQARDAR